MRSRRDRGRGLVDYSLILALGVIVVVLVVTLMGRQIQSSFQGVVHTLQGP